MHSHADNRSDTLIARSVVLAQKGVIWHGALYGRFLAHIYYITYITFHYIHYISPTQPRTHLFYVRAARAHEYTDARSRALELTHARTRLPTLTHTRTLSPTHTHIHTRTLELSPGPSLSRSLAHTHLGWR